MILPLAWIPLIDPIYSVVPHLTDYWLLFVFPLVLTISLVYQTIRRQDLAGLVSATLWMSAKVLFFMVLIAIVIQVVFSLGIHYFSAPLS